MDYFANKDTFKFLVADVYEWDVYIFQNYIKIYLHLRFKYTLYTLFQF